MENKRQLDIRPLGNRPLSVIRGHRERDIRKLYEAGVQVGNGTKEQQLAVKETLDRMERLDEILAKDQLTLSSRSPYVVAESGGHDVQATEPELIVEETRQVLDSLLLFFDVMCHYHSRIISPKVCRISSIVPSSSSTE